MTATAPAKPTSNRTVWMIAGLMTPLVILAALWFAVSNWLLAPAIPDATTPPDQLVAFIIHEQGLPRLGAAEAERVLRTQVARLAADDQLSKNFLRFVRISSPEDQKAFRENLFDVVLHMLLADADAYESTAGPARGKTLDAAIVKYNKIARGLSGQKDKIDSNVAKGIFGSEKDMVPLAFSRTNGEQRAKLMRFSAALQSRVAEILADPDLTADFEARIAAAP
jgi:hypothetical protein